MDWLTEWINAVLRSQIWKFIANHFFWVDWITLMSLVGGFIFGIKKGFFRMIVINAELLFIVFVTFYYDQTVESQIHTFLPYIAPNMRPVFGFALTVVPLATLVIVIDSYLSKIFQTKVPQKVKVLGGAVLGVFFGIFLWSLESGSASSEANTDSCLERKNISSTLFSTIVISLV